MKPGLLTPALSGCSPWESSRIAFENYKAMEAWADKLEAALRGVCVSYEAYCLVTGKETKPEAEYDEYDHMMAPRWKTAVELIGYEK